MSTHPTTLSRKNFLRLTAASLGAMAVGPLLSACNQAEPVPPTAVSQADTPVPPQPTASAADTSIPPTQAATATVKPTSAPTVAPTITPVPRPIAALPALIQRFPAVATSRLVRTHHTGAWDGKILTPAVMRQMVDSSVTQLTGLTDAREAWAALFQPTERIAIKVNAFSNSTIWTHAPLVQALTDSLVEAGHPAEQIVIYDFTSNELKTAGYTVNQDGPGVRCYGTDSHYGKGFKVETVSTELSSILLDCDALINIPVLKSHMIAAMTYALKNHYGTVRSPESLHYEIDGKIAALNALPEIQGKTRLIVGDALQANLNYRSSWPYWEPDWDGDSILMSFDPVAVDTIGAQILGAARQDDVITKRAIAGFDAASALGLGTNDPAKIELIETTLA
jgi:uncharacterized protein (DUF362 family)